MSATVKIKSNEDAISVIERYLQGTLPESFKYELSGWPTLKISLKGEKFDQSLTPSVMEGFIELQKAVNRAYAEAVYGDSTKRLTEEEKDRLELTVKVDKGSSIFNVEFSDAALNLGQALVTKMDPITIVVTVLGTGLILAGRSIWAKHLETQRLVKLESAKNERDREAFSSMQFMSAQETKRMQVMAELLKENQQLSRIQDIAKESKTDLIKSFAEAEEVNIDGLLMSGEQALSLTKNARSESVQTRIDGVYKVVRVDSSNAENFKVKISNKDNGQTFEAIVQDETSNDSIKQLIQHAEWSRSYVRLSINAKIIRGQVNGAVILGAESTRKERP